MPHLVIQYSDNLEPHCDLGLLCRTLAGVIADLSIFPVGGIRVRAYPARHYAVADQHPENAFADMTFRIAAGRSAAQKAETGKALMAAAEEHFAAQLQSPHFALSLEIVDIGPEFSWKSNSIHPRLQALSKP